MKPEELLDAIGEVKDHHILDAHTPSRSRRPRWYAAIAACLALLLGLGSLFGPAGAGSSGSEDLSYFVYAGPVLPLTARGGTEGITAERGITLDFQEYDGTDRGGGKLHVVDSYILTNHTAEAQTLDLYYPYTASLSDEKRCPLIWVDGSAVVTELYPGSYAGGFEGPWIMGDPLGLVKPIEGSGNLDLPASFEDYRALLQDGSYLDQALAGYQITDQTAYVYRLHDFTFPREDEDAIYELHLECTADPKGTQVYSVGFDGSGSDRETGRYRWMVNLRSKGRPQDDAYVIALGTDLSGYTLQGYQQVSPGEDVPQDVSCTVTRYETTWRHVLLHLLEAEGLYDPQNPEEANFAPGARFHIRAGELYLGLMAELLDQFGPWGQRPAERYADGDLSFALHEAENAKRVLYLSFQITIPAGAEMTVAAAMTKEPSYDLSGSGNPGDGYDFAATLGSSLTFTAQTAALKNAQFIEIIAQNFGFDPNKGITTVPLTEEFHWLKVRGLKANP